MKCAQAPSRWVFFLATLVALALLPAPSSAADELVPISTIQFTDDPSGDSPYVGEVVTTQGAVSAVYRQGYVLAEPAGGPWSGVYVYDADHRPAVGDRVRLSAAVDEYYGMTELVNVTEYIKLGEGEPPAPSLLRCAEAGAEAYEGVLLRIENARVMPSDLGYGEWEIADESGALRVDDMADIWYIPRAGDALDYIQGVLFYSFEHFKIEPRQDGDIGTAPAAPFALHGAVLTPEEVLADAYVIVQGQRIAAVHTSPPAGMPIIETEGLVVPGLINAHDHPAYNVFPALRLEGTFANRYEWQADARYRVLRQSYNALSAAGLMCEMWKYAEVRALMAGSTTQQGAYTSDYWDCYAHPRILVRNPERMKPTLRTEVFPLELSEGERETIRRRVANGAYSAVVIHLSEGTDAGAAAEFETWDSWGLLPTSVVIHGIPYGPAQFARMHEAGASLVWSPQSNLRLYGLTVDPRPALAQGVPVALAPDWTLTGSYSLLGELKVAQRINEERYGGALTHEMLVQMVTTTPGEQLGLGHDVGRLAAGYLADIAVIRPKEETDAPYEALVKADAQDVQLVLVGGEALYGTEELIGALNPGDRGEPVTVCGERRRLRLALEAPAIPKSGQTLEEIRAALLAVEPDILPLDPCAAYRIWLPAISR